MYYYIFDVRKCKNRRQIETIKDHLSDLGISGEFAVPDRIRPARDLAEQGVFKGYSTIVAIGADDLIDEVASVMLSKQQVFGVVPLVGVHASQCHGHVRAQGLRGAGVAADDRGHGLHGQPGFGTLLGDAAEHQVGSNGNEGEDDAE